MKSHQLIDRAWVKQSVYGNVVNKDNRERQVQAVTVSHGNEQETKWVGITAATTRRKGRKKKIRLN